MPSDNPGALSVRGDMNHTGMAPVFGEAEAAVDGVFTVPFEWTMAGGWIVEASLELVSGETVTQSFNLEIMSEAGADNMADMDRSEMDHDAMPGETSAAYLRIDNRGGLDMTITSARTEAAAAVEFHETVIEDDIARMERLPTLSIPADQTLHLRPGGIHIMLLELTKNLEAGSSIVLELEFESGVAIALGLPIMQMPMEDDMTEFQVGVLVFSQMWARPASAGAMSEMDHGEMQMESESSE